ncbi:MAG: hypothetical protein ABIS59_01645 [Candidatus Saccharibacteria bacterium]
MQCHGCRSEIIEGQHYMKVRIELATDFPPSLIMRPIEPTVLESVVHGPRCLVDWTVENEIIKDVFLR